MNDLAKELNNIIKNGSPTYYELLSSLGKDFYMPKGIIVQSQEAKKNAFKYDATIGIAKEKGEPMYLASLKSYFNNLSPSQIFPYASPHGVPEIRSLWREKIVKENSCLKNAEQISNPVVTQALTNGLMLVGDLFVDKGDEILIPDMLWDNYSLIFETRYKGVIKNFPFFNDDLKGFNVDALDKALSRAKKKIILILNFPNNPTGYSITEKEAVIIVEIIKKHAEKGKKILVVSDDAYYGLLYEDGLIQGSIFSRFAGLHPNIVSVKIDGFTKEYYVWGFRIGFITFTDYWNNKEAYAALEDKTASAIRSSISNCSMTKQSILLTINKNTEYAKEKQEKYEILKARALKVKEVVYNKKYSDCWDVYPFNAGYFMCLKIKGVKSNDVRLHALKKYGVGTISFGDYDLRVAFSCVEIENIEEIFDLIAQAVRDLKK